MIHHVFANRSNIGDWLSARAIRKLLGPCDLAEHLCDAPFVEETLAVLRRAGPGDTVLVGGGGLFMDYFVPFWEGLRELNPQVSLCLWGVGFCDMKREPSRPPLSLLNEIVARSSLCVVRDDLSRDALRERNRVSVAPCPALAMVESAPPGWGLLHVDNYDTAGAEVYEAMVEYGERFADDTRRPYRATNNRIEPGRERELEHVLERYRRSDVIVSSALHGCIIGVAMGRRVVAVSGDRKIDEFMRATGLADWLLDTGEVERLPALLARMEEQPSTRDWVRHAIQANAAVAGSVRRLASGLEVGA